MAYIESLTADAIIALINNGSWPQNFPITSGVIGSAGSQVAVDVSLTSNVTVTLKNEGAAPTTAGVVVFEGSINSTDGSNGDWFQIPGVRTDLSGIYESSRAASSLAAGAFQTYGWEFSVNALKYFRVRGTTAFTASTSAKFSIARGAYATEPAVSVAGTVLTTPSVGSSYALTTTASLNASSIKAGVGGNMFELSVFNATAALIHIKLYDKNGVPAPATDAALLRQVYPVAAGGFLNVEFGAIGKKFASGIGLATTALVAATDATVIAAGALINYTYI